MDDHHLSYITKFMDHVHVKIMLIMIFLIHYSQVFLYHFKRLKIIVIKPIMFQQTFKYFYKACSTIMLQILLIIPQTCSSYF
jgi:hypothetical protein